MWLKGLHFTRDSLSAVVLLVAMASPLDAAGAVDTDFDRWFTGQTLRIQMQQFGSAREEHFFLSALFLDGPWPGTRRRFDRLNLGDYFLTLSDVSTHEPLYTMGFDTSFLAEESWSVCPVSIRVPFPRAPVRASIGKRTTDNTGFLEIWVGTIDPADPRVQRRPAPPGARAEVIADNGPSDKKVDVVILGDGYAEAERRKFSADARRAAQYLFAASPFKENRSAFNVRAVFFPSDDSGITSPLDGLWRRTAYRAAYNDQGVERRINFPDEGLVREVAAVVPYDFLIMITNSRRYGGSAAYQRSSVAAADSSLAEYLVVHEFGHNFAGLADEYFTLAKCGPGEKAEPWQPNVTAISDRAHLKWAAAVEPGTPVPTPWSKAEYERFDQEFAKRYFAMRGAKEPEAAVEALIARSVSEATAMLRLGQFGVRIGAFEGANNESCGMFRPASNCTMFTLTPANFCSVCAGAVRRAVEAHADTK